MDMLKKMAGGSDGDNQGQQMQQGQAGGGGDHSAHIIM